MPHGIGDPDLAAGIGVRNQRVIQHENAFCIGVALGEGCAEKGAVLKNRSIVEEYTSIRLKRVLLIGNTEYITKEFVETTFPQSKVMVVGNTEFGSANKIKLFRVRKPSVKAILETYGFDLIVYFSAGLRFRSAVQNDAEELSEVLKYASELQKKVKILYLSSIDSSLQEKTDKSILASASEKLCELYSKKHGLDIKTVQIPYLYSGTYKKDFLYGVFEDLYNKKTVRIPEASTSKMHFLSLGDLSDLIARIVDNWKGGSGVATLKGCYNDGNITVEGKSFATINVAGVVANSVAPTIVKDSEYPYCYNAGNITVGNKSGEKTIATTKTVVGGYVASHTGGAITSDIANTGTITVSNLKSPSLYVGGIFAHLNKAGVVDSAAQFTNTGDILVSNIDVAANQVFIGGVIGDTLSAINGAQSYCGILAPEGTNTGWVLGSTRNSESKILATNCSLGGNTYEWEDEEEYWKPKALISNNVHNYLYGSGSATNWSGTDNYDGVTLITTKPTVTLAPAVE
jgi:hypothetical protein